MICHGFDDACEDTSGETFHRSEPYSATRYFGRGKRVMSLTIDIDDCCSICSTI